MIKNSSTQKGSAHVIIVILVVALLGTLGFIFWQNFIHKEPVTTKTETPATKVKDSEKSKDNEEQLVSVHITDLGLIAMVPESLGDLTSEPVHLEGDQAVNSVVLSSEKAEASGCAKNSGPLGYLTYDADKGGTLVASARGSELYYLSPDKTCDAVTSKDINDLQTALKSLVSDDSSEKTAR